MSFSDIFELLGKILLVPPFYSDRESELSIAASLLAAIVGAVVGRIFVRPHRNAWVILVLLATAVGTFALYWFHLYGKADNLSVTGLRFFTVYGPRQRPDMAFHRFLKSVRDGKPITLYGDGEQTRDFTYVSDLIDVLQRSLVQGRPGLVYNVGGGQRISVLKVIETIGAVTGREVRIDRQEGQKGDMRDTLADTAQAARDLGFVPKTPLAAGLKAEWEWICS